MVLWAFAVLLAYFIKGLTGFGNTLVVTSIMAYTMDNAAITPVELLLTYPANLIMSWKHRKQAEWRVWLPMGIMIVLGGIPGMLLLKNLDTRLLKLLFGIFVVLMGLEMLLRKNTVKQMPKILDFIVSLTAGVMCGLFGVGAMMGAYLGRTMKDTQSYKGNLAFIFMIENTMRIIVYIIGGLLSLSTLRDTLILAPFMALGLFLGIKSGSIISEKNVKLCVIIMLIISGIALFVTNL